MARKKKNLPVGFFPETSQKEVLRARDMELVRKLAAAKGRPLCYCGLTGRWAADVLKWREWLVSVVAVQFPISDEAERVRFEADLMLRLTPYFNGNVELIYANVWDYLASEAFTRLADVPDVVNLDFCGGFVYNTDMCYPKQRTAFQRLFEVAGKAGEDFVLLLTLMPRDKGKETYKKYLGEVIRSLEVNTVPGNMPKFSAALQASQNFHQQDNLRLFKACLPILVSDIGRSHNFNVKVAYVRLYTKMIHMAFECNFVRNMLGLAGDPRAILRLLNHPMRKLLANGREEQDWPPQVSLE
jgi:hypothetical protein